MYGSKSRLERKCRFSVNPGPDTKLAVGLHLPESDGYEFVDGLDALTDTVATENKALNRSFEGPADWQGESPGCR